MSYVSANGTVGGRKSIGRSISDFLAGILNFFALIFTSITNPPQRLEGSGTYGQRNNGRSYRGGGGGSTLGGGGRGGSNIRGVKNLQGNSEARMGGG